MRAQLGLAEMRDVAAVEPDAAAGRLDQPQHAARHRRFAAAGFADQAERLADAEREADAVDRMHGADLPAQHAAAHRIMLDEVGDLEQGARSRSCRLRQFPPRASRPRDGRRPNPAAADIRCGSARSRACSAARRRSPPAGWSTTAPCREFRSAGRLSWRRAPARPGSRPSGRGCRDAADRRTASSTSASSTFLPAYITITRCAVCATTPRSCVIRISPVPSSFCRSRISARICAWMVTSSAVVGSSAISSAGRQASAIAIIARWRMPPESWCGYSRARRSGSGMRTSRSISTALCPALASPSCPGAAAPPR